MSFPVFIDFMRPRLETRWFLLRECISIFTFHVRDQFCIVCFVLPHVTSELLSFLMYFRIDFVAQPTAAAAASTDSKRATSLPSVDSRMIPRLKVFRSFSFTACFI